MMNKRRPCKDCVERQVGCHKDCERYRQLREYYDQIGEKRRKENDWLDYEIKTTIHNTREARGLH